MENNKITILITDGHKLVRVGLKALFANYEELEVIAEAQNGKETIEKQKIYKPNILIVDLMLNDMNPAIFIKKVFEVNEDQKIIALVQDCDLNIINDILTLGVKGCALKDISTDCLIMLIKSVYEGAMWLSKEIVDIIRTNNNGIIPKKVQSRAQFKAKHSNLTEREYEVLKLVVDVKSNNEIANLLTISEHTAKAHVCNIIQKLVVDDRTQAAVKAIKEGLV